MSRRYLMGLDVGGGSGRSLLVDVDTGSVHAASRHWRFETAPGTSGLGSEIDLELVWKLLAEASREVLAAAGVSANEVEGVASTSMRLGTVLLDSDGASILAVPNRDAGAAGPGILMSVNHGERIFERRIGHAEIDGDFDLDSHPLGVPYGPISCCSLPTIHCPWGTVTCDVRYRSRRGAGSARESDK